MSYNISPLCDVAQTSDCGVFLFLTLNISPLCDVAQTSDCGTHCLYFCHKPFMWCRPDARLWHYYSCSFLSRSHSDTRLALVLLFLQFPLEESFRHSLAPVLLFLQFPLEESFRPSFGTSTTILAVSARGVIQTLVWHPVITISMSERTG